MTAEPTSSTPDIIVEIENRVNEQNSSILEDLFFLGYTKSEIYTVYKDDAGLEIKVQFRTLTPYEVRDIQERVGQYNTPLARIITEQIETLARTIIHINHMPLILGSSEREAHFLRTKKYPSPLEMAKNILTEKLKSEYLLDAIYEAYIEFVKGVQDSFDNIKKKLKTSTSSS